MSKTLQYPFGPLDLTTQPKDLSSDDNLGIRLNDATQRNTLGTRKMDWDGGVYRYVKAGSTYTSYQAAVWTGDTSAGVSYEAPNSGSSAGQNVVHIAEASITEDEYAGGYMLLFHSTGDGNVTTVIGNSASTGGLVDVYLEHPLPVDVTTSDAFELYPNPYDDVQQGNNSTNTAGFIGIPQALLTDNYFGWVKTWGPTFISPQSTVGGSGLAAGYFRHDGSIDVRANISPGTVTDQYAGYRLIGSASGDGPLFMLQVSI